ncbi:MAG: extracellular solute-binding protein [Thermoflexales bacterium]|nr:extracellular solute-binding protein [Thermoflexales bacterium]
MDRLLAWPKLLLARLTRGLAGLRLPPAPAWLPAWRPRLPWGLLRKLFWLSLAAGLAAATLALVASQGFQPPAVVAQIPAELTRLSLAGDEVILWYAMDAAASRELVELVDEFNAENPWGITVVPQAQANYVHLLQRLETTFARGAAPDLTALYPYHAAAYALDGRVVGLDAYIDHPEWGLSQADLNDLLPGLLESERNSQFDKQVVSFPLGPDAFVLVYNVDWLRSLGHQGPPASWTTFKELCEQAVTDMDGDGQPDTAGYAFVPDSLVFSALVLARGGQLLSADGRQVLFNSPAGVQALSTLQELYRSKCAYSVAGWGWDRQDLATARVLFNIVPSSALLGYQAIIERESAFRWGVAPLPHDTPTPVTPLQGQSWTVLKTTPERQVAAWLFVRWFAQARQVRRWARASSTVPIRLSVARELLEIPDTPPAFKTVLELATYGQPEPSTPAWNALRGMAVEAMQAVVEGADPKNALDRAAMSANSILGEERP